MTIERTFNNWQALPLPYAHQWSCSPNLALVLVELQRRFGPITNLGCFGQRPVRGGTAPSSHSYGSAIDVGYEPSFDPFVMTDVCPWLVARSGELHLQAIHDYRRRRIWRAGRTQSESDACTTWWRGQRSSQITGMGQQWANHLHLETTAAGWADTTPIEERWTE